MAKVPFIFAKLDVNYADHPKIASLSDTAFRAHVEMILYARKYLTDGVIRNPIANRFANRFGLDSITELETNDEANPSLTRLDNGDIVLHGFLDLQDSRASAEQRSQVNADNGRKGGRPPKTHSLTESLTESQSETKPESESESESESIKDTRVTATVFDEFWTLYPRKVGKDAARKAFKTAVKRATRDAVMAGLRQYASGPLPEARFIPNPATWLNQGRWADGPASDGNVTSIDEKRVNPDRGW